MLKTCRLLWTAPLLVGLCSCPGTASAAEPRPNILWIIMDDAGAELPCYGEKAIQTPHVDRLASEGTKFDRAFLTASVCSPSRSAMITGMYQTSLGAHQHRSGRGAEKIRLPAGVEPIPALFQRAGYYTCNGPWPPRLGGGIGKTDYNFEWDRRIYDGADWSGRQPGQPFFAQIQLWGGKNRDDNGRWYREVAPKALVTLTPPESVTLPPYYPRDPVLQQDWAQYLDCIRYCDWQLGQILRRLEEERILDQTVIFFMGDNGVSHARGKQFLYDEGIRAPFILRGPGVARGAVRNDLIEHIDMAATSLALAGLAVPAWMQGRDLLARNYRPREAVFAARDRCDETVDHIRSVRTERFKYIRNFLPDRPYLQPNAYKDHKPTLTRLRELRAQGRLPPLSEKLLFAPRRAPEELYDLQADPFETNNLAADPALAATLADLRARLEKWITATADRGRQPEPPAMFDSDMAAYLAELKGARKDEVQRNIDLMKQWAAEGK
jgi:arylsulfatase A-like enzyme